MRVNCAYQTQKSLLFPVCVYMDELARTCLLRGRRGTLGSPLVGKILPLSAANCRLSSARRARRWCVKVGRAPPSAGCCGLRAPGGRAQGRQGGVRVCSSCSSCPRGKLGSSSPQRAETANLRQNTTAHKQDSQSSHHARSSKKKGFRIINLYKHVRAIKVTILEVM